MDSLLNYLLFFLRNHYRAIEPADGDWTSYIWKFHYWMVAAGIGFVPLAAWIARVQSPVNRGILLATGWFGVCVLSFVLVGLLQVRACSTRSFRAFLAYCTAPWSAALGVFVAGLFCR